MYRYNFDKDDWEYMTTYPKQLKTGNCTFTADNKNQQFYFWEVHGDNLRNIVYKKMNGQLFIKKPRMIQAVNKD